MALDDWRAVLKRDPCAYCGFRFVAADMQVDHVQPRVLSGLDTAENFTGSCGGCNRRKGALSLLGFLLREDWAWHIIEQEAATTYSSLGRDPWPGAMAWAVAERRRESLVGR